MADVAEAVCIVCAVSSWMADEVSTRLNGALRETA